MLFYKSYFRMNSRTEQNVTEASVAEKWANGLIWNESNMLCWKHLTKKIFFYLPQCQAEETNAWGICSPKVSYKSVHFRDKEFKNHWQLTARKSAELPRMCSTNTFAQIRLKLHTNFRGQKYTSICRGLFTISIKNKSIIIMLST